MTSVLRMLGAVTVGIVAGIVLLAAPVVAQTNTPTSFQGGPDASVTTVQTPVDGVSGIQGGGTAQETSDDDDDSSPARWAIVAIVLVAVAGGGLLAVSRRGPRAPVRA